MEEAVAHGVAQERAQDGEAERAQVEAGGAQRRVIGDGDAVDPFERQHAPRRAPPIDARHAKAARARLGGIAGDVVGHLRDGRGLQPHVHLDLHGPRQGLDDSDGPQPSRRGMEALDLAGGEEVAGKIAPEALLDAGAQDLDRHLAANAVVDDGGLVHLGDGSGGHRRTELGEMIFEPATERLLDRLACFTHRKRRQPVLQVPEVAGQLGPDQVVAGGKELAELDVAGPQAGQRAGNAPLLGLADAQRPGQGSDRQGGDAGEMQRQGHLGAGRHEAHAVLCQHDAGTRETEDVAEGGCHGARRSLESVDAKSRAFGQPSI
jgi:hypothetical protein